MRSARLATSSATCSVYHPQIIASLRSAVGCIHTTTTVPQPPENSDLNKQTWHAGIYRRRLRGNRLRHVNCRDRASRSSFPGQHSRNGMDHIRLRTPLVISRFQNAVHATQQFAANLIPCRTLRTTPSRAHKIRRESAGLSLQWQRQLHGLFDAVQLIRITALPSWKSTLSSG